MLQILKVPTSITQTPIDISGRVEAEEVSSSSSSESEPPTPPPSDKKKKPTKRV
jgi:hypothetical protein